MHTLSTEALRPLKQSLLDAYGHFADRRLKRIDSGHLFIIDDRQETDHGADGKLYGWFCLVFADVVDANAIQITLRGDIPRSVMVQQWIKNFGAKDSPAGLSFKITPANLAQLTSLAKAFRSIVAPGSKYTVKSYKYVCPRTAASLDRLFSVLSKHWST